MDSWVKEMKMKDYGPILLYKLPGEVSERLRMSTIFIGDVNAHSPKWGCNDTNHSGKEVEDLLNTSTLELIYNCNDPHTFLHYNGTKPNPNLLLVSADLSQSTKRSVLEDPGSGHRQILAEISFPVKTGLLNINPFFLEFQEG
ncbi:hypothetical protein CEXT_416191 [Caerostris extrusa]|uniref:Endonuclease/exonuclease/phosphatase domain-containing protein n=1 Tax=Caerostris extrusa TaxID=172846 RepID=A0AAV4MTT6_CAEEX|nr:hypothetical protein CEXT_416191 [Caerostris extrusa]